MVIILVLGILGVFQLRSAGRPNKEPGARESYLTGISPGTDEREIQ